MVATAQPLLNTILTILPSNSPELGDKIWKKQKLTWYNIKQKFSVSSTKRRRRRRRRRRRKIKEEEEEEELKKKKRKKKKKKKKRKKKKN